MGKPAHFLWANSKLQCSLVSYRGCAVAMLQEQANVPVKVVTPAVLSAAQSTRQAMEFTQRLVVTLITHPRLATWLGQRVAEEKEKEPQPP